MKRLILTTITTLFFFSCNTVKPPSPKDGPVTIIGTVVSVKNEMDGNVYTIKTKNDEIYTALLSIANLNRGTYVDLKIGNTVALKGGKWVLNGKKQLTVREILSDNTNNFRVRGEAKSFDYGDDGYAVSVETSKGENYIVGISFNDLGKNHSKYKEFKKGEVLNVAGELWNIGNQLHVTARDILPLKDETITIHGTVQSTENGKDGYTALIKTKEGELYKATISIPNIGEGKKFKHFMIGESVTVKGEFWEMGGEKRILVREIL